MLPAQVFYEQLVLIVPPMRTYKLAQLRFGERFKNTTNQNEFNSGQTMQAIYFIIIAQVASYCNSIFAFFAKGGLFYAYNSKTKTEGLYSDI